ncbi:MAG: hypothetical protein J7L45_01885 [Candidatus Aenigmarchaeota archaeon]|nr:hypothetical protein [Candidatus Aenigmarchaeota archaeon]
MDEIEIVRKLSEILETDEDNIIKKIESLKKTISDQRKTIEELEDKLKRTKQNQY